MNIARIEHTKDDDYAVYVHDEYMTEGDIQHCQAWLWLWQQDYID